MIIKICIISFLYSFSSYASEVRNVDKLVACSRSMEAYGKGRSLNLNDNLHVVPAARDNKNGYYVFTNTDSYFCALSGKKSQYLIKLKIEKEQPQYLAYDTENGFIEQPEPETKDNGYVKAKCNAYKDEESHAALEQEVKTRLASVSKADNEAKTPKKEKDSKYYINNDKFLHENELALAKKYPKVLKTCSEVDGEVGMMAKEEISKSSSSKNNFKFFKGNSFPR